MASRIPRRTRHRLRRGSRYRSCRPFRPDKSSASYRRRTWSRSERRDRPGQPGNRSPRDRRRSGEGPYRSAGTRSSRNVGRPRTQRRSGRRVRNAMTTGDTRRRSHNHLPRRCRPQRHRRGRRWRGSPSAHRSRTRPRPPARPVGSQARASHRGCASRPPGSAPQCLRLGSSKAVGKALEVPRRCRRRCSRLAHREHAHALDDGALE